MGLSVIVPVYNGEKYIEDCLNSIINQTYNDLQIIVINDGSKDNTKSIISNMAKKDSRIEIINKENGGVSSARNLGLEYVKKDFVTFVDSDDTLDEDMYEILMQYANSEEFDIVHCGYKRINNNGIKLVNGTGNVIIQEKYEALECIIDGKLFVPALWNKIYKKSLFDNVRFDESLKINEDVLVNYELFKNSDKSIFIDEAKYNYFEREESACKNTNDVKKSEDCLKVAKKISDDCKNSSLNKNAINKYLGCLIGLYRSYYYSKDNIYKTNIKSIRKEIHLFYKNYNITGRKNKISALLIIYVPYLYGLFYKLYDRIRVPNWDV